MQPQVEESRRPDFFIVGAPKCGTSALASYLRDHPQIFMSWPKEPLFFCEDFPDARIIATLDEYIALFRDVPAGTRAAGEASAMYLYSKVALERIREFSPEAKIIAMVRSPVDLVQAFHQQMLYSLTENEVDFAAAWRLQEKRQAGEQIPPGCTERRFLQYAEVARLGEQVDRLYSLFPADRIKVVLLEDLATDARAVYSTVLEFLGVEDDGREVFERVNATPQHRSRLLSRLTQRPPQWMVDVAGKAKSALGAEGTSLLDWIRRANSERAPRPELDASLRAELVTGFAADISVLARRLDRDLSSWLEA